MNTHLVGLQCVEGGIDRRLLVNATLDVDLVVPLLPPGVAPAVLGRSFDGLAYRVAVTTSDGAPAVHIVRRETTDRLARAVGGRLFPGTHRRVDTDVTADDLRVVAGGHGGPPLVVDVVDEPPGPDHASVLGDDVAASAFFVRDVPVRFLRNEGAA